MRVCVCVCCEGGWGRSRSVLSDWFASQLSGCIGAQSMLHTSRCSSSDGGGIGRASRRTPYGRLPSTGERIPPAPGKRGEGQRGVESGSSPNQAGMKVFITQSRASTPGSPAPASPSSVFPRPAGTSQPSGSKTARGGGIGGGMGPTFS